MNIEHECPKCGSDLDFYKGAAICPNDDCNYKESVSNCVKCRIPALEAKQVISRGRYLYEDEGEWVCSDECLVSVEKERSETDYFLGT